MALSFKRLSIFCHDITKSLHVYCDVLGLHISMDKTITGAAAGRLLGLPPCTIRIVLLAPSAGDPPVLGLFDITDTELETRAAGPSKLVRKQTALVLGTDEFEATLAKLRDAGLELLCEPEDYVTPATDAGAPAMRYREVIFFDPDDVLVSIMQVTPVTGT